MLNERFSSSFLQLQQEHAEVVLNLSRKECDQAYQAQQSICVEDKVVRGGSPITYDCVHASNLHSRRGIR